MIYNKNGASTPSVCYPSLDPSSPFQRFQVLPGLSCGHIAHSLQNKEAKSLTPPCPLCCQSGSCGNPSHCFTSGVEVREVSQDRCQVSGPGLPWESSASRLTLLCPHPTCQEEGALSFTSIYILWRIWAHFLPALGILNGFPRKDLACF